MMHGPFFEFLLTLNLAFFDRWISFGWPLWPIIGGPATDWTGTANTSGPKKTDLGEGLGCELVISDHHFWSGTDFMKARKPVNAFGIASFILGLLALLACCTPLIHALVFPLGGIALLLGAIGLLLSLFGGRSSVRSQWTGVILGGLAIFARVVTVSGSPRHETPAPAATVRWKAPSPRALVPGNTVVIGRKGALSGDVLFAIDQDVFEDHQGKAHWTSEGAEGTDRYIAYRDSLLEEGKLFSVPPGTVAEVVETSPHLVLLRILEGKHDGKTGWIAIPWARHPEAQDLAHLDPKVRSTPPRDGSPSTRSASEAATLLRSAQTLEQTSKSSGAASLYRQVVRDFPDTVEARTAASRLKALAVEK
jgi:hypothetical protein